MKKCPTCQMTVDEKNECPFCGTNLTYEPIVHTEKERLVFNRYYIFYLLKCSWFSLFCVMVGVMKTVLHRPPMNYMFWIAVFFLAVSLTASLFQRRLTNQLRRVFTEEAIPFELGFEKYILGATAIALFLFI